MSAERGFVLALSGGIGGAKLALGLYRTLPPGTLTVVANTGDDFEHLGLSVSPDLDTLLYTLAGIDNSETGWGRRDETWTFMAALESLGGETWFKLGDGDLATHIERTRRLAAGESLSQITDDFRRRLGISARLLPMTDDRVRTRLLTPEGWLDFQDYFVRRQCAPSVREIAFAGAKTAHPHPDFLAALANQNLRMVVICPSNPFISIDPILGLPGVRGGIAFVPRAGRRGLADHRRQGCQGSHRQDDGGTRPAGRGGSGGAPLRRYSRPLCDRRGGCRGDGEPGPALYRDPHLDGDPC